MHSHAGSQSVHIHGTSAREPYQDVELLTGEAHRSKHPIESRDDLPGCAIDRAQAAGSSLLSRTVRSSSRATARYHTTSIEQVSAYAVISETRAPGWRGAFAGRKQALGSRRPVPQRNFTGCGRRHFEVENCPSIPGRELPASSTVSASPNGRFPCGGGA